MLTILGDIVLAVELALLDIGTSCSLFIYDSKGVSLRVKNNGWRNFRLRTADPAPACAPFWPWELNKSVNKYSFSNKRFLFQYSAVKLFLCSDELLFSSFGVYNIILWIMPAGKALLKVLHNSFLLYFTCSTLTKKLVFQGHTVH